MVQNLDDLRRETRVSSEKVIKVSFVGEEHQGQVLNYECRSQDISGGGLKIVSHFSLSIGDTVPMEIDLGESWAVISVVAEVKWCLEVDTAPTYYIGVKLTQVKDSNLQVWQKFVQSL